jgi:U5 small nuclear ribonucleoprotein component
MDDSLYDEFGNYLGPDLEDEDDLDLEEEEEEEEEEQQVDQEDEDMAGEHAQESSLMQIDGTELIQNRLLKAMKN